MERAGPYLEKAFQLSDRLTEKDKLYIIAWHATVKRDSLSAIETYRKFIANSPLEVEAYQRLCWLLISQRRFDEALTVARRGLLIDSEAKDLYNALGGIHSHLDNDSETLAAYQRYVQLAPTDPNAFDSLGLGHQQFGRYDEAVAAYQRALALNPESRVAVIHLGNACLQRGQYRAAIEQYRRYVEIARDDQSRGRGHEYLAYAYLKTGELGRAEAESRLAARYFRQPVWSSLYLANARGDRRAAQAWKSKLRAKLSQAEHAERGVLRLYYYYLGYLAQTSGQATEAIEHFKEALRHQKVYWRYDPLEDCLALAYLELGRLDEAIAEYERILRLNPNYPLAQFHLGQAYERKGDRERAREAYRSFLQTWKDADEDVPEVINAKAWSARQ
jgi:tetratricopeptide (TPR) repeat protein